jgi:hypothetical protein
MAVKCKYCGGTSGYMRTHSVEYVSHLTWDNRMIDTEETGNGSEFKLVECQNCGRKMRHEYNEQ